MASSFSNSKQQQHITTTRGPRRKKQLDGIISKSRKNHKGLIARLRTAHSTTSPANKSVVKHNAAIRAARRVTKQLLGDIQNSFENGILITNDSKVCNMGTSDLNLNNGDGGNSTVVVDFEKIQNAFVEMLKTTKAALEYCAELHAKYEGVETQLESLLKASKKWRRAYIECDRKIAFSKCDNSPLFKSPCAVVTNIVAKGKKGKKK